MTWAEEVKFRGKDTDYFRHAWSYLISWHIEIKESREDIWLQLFSATTFASKESKFGFENNWNKTMYKPVQWNFTILQWHPKNPGRTNFINRSQSIKRIMIVTCAEESKFQSWEIFHFLRNHNPIPITRIETWPRRSKTLPLLHYALQRNFAFTVTGLFSRTDNFE